MNALLRPEPLSVEEYFEFEETSEERHDFYGGLLVAVEAASKNHGDVLQNIEIPIARHLKGTGCRAYTQSLKVFVDFHAPFSTTRISSSTAREEGRRQNLSAAMSLSIQH